MMHMDNIVSHSGQKTQIVPIFRTGHIWLRRSGSRAMKISIKGNTTQQENDDADDDVDDEDDDDDDDDDIYIMMQCLSVCVSRKIITSSC